MILAIDNSYSMALTKISHSSFSPMSTTKLDPITLHVIHSVSNIFFKIICYLKVKEGGQIKVVHSVVKFDEIAVKI